MDMEYRKLVKFGTSTFCVSLPKLWLREHKLLKGDIICIEEAEDGTLRVGPKEAAARHPVREMSIDISGRGIEEIKRQVLAAYINDYAVIQLRGDIGQNLKELRQLFQQFIGLEVFELSDEAITAKAFEDRSETHPLKAIHNMDNITRTMFAELADVLTNRERACLISEKDAEVNRLYYFTLKLVTRGLNEGEVAGRWGVARSELAFLMMLADKLEKIADRVKRIARIVSESDSPEAEAGLVSAFVRELELNYRDAMEAFYRKDTALANRVINTHRQNASHYDSRNLSCLRKTREKAGCGIPFVREYLARTSKLTEDVARIVLNLNPCQTPGKPGPQAS